MPKPDDKASHRYLVLHPPCSYCTHLTHTGSLDLRGWTCSAFPVEIPYDILKRHSSHTEPDMVQEGDDVFESRVFDEGEHGRWVIDFGGEWTRVDPAT
jgi:hypothetical protein